MSTPKAFERKGYRVALVAAGASRRSTPTFFQLRKASASKRRLSADLEQEGARRDRFSPIFARLRLGGRARVTAPRADGDLRARRRRRRSAAVQEQQRVHLLGEMLACVGCCRDMAREKSGAMIFAIGGFPCGRRPRRRRRWDDGVRTYALSLYAELASQGVYVAPRLDRPRPRARHGRRPRRRGPTHSSWSSAARPGARARPRRRRPPPRSRPKMLLVCSRRRAARRLRPPSGDFRGAGARGGAPLGGFGAGRMPGCAPSSGDWRRRARLPRPPLALDEVRLRAFPARSGRGVAGWLQCTAGLGETAPSAEPPCLRRLPHGRLRSAVATTGSAFEATPPTLFRFARESSRRTSSKAERRASKRRRAPQSPLDGAQPGIVLRQSLRAALPPLAPSPSEVAGRAAQAPRSAAAASRTRQAI